MKGPYSFTETNVDGNALAQSGSYILVDDNNIAIYVGRSDSDLKARLKKHFSEKETNECIRKNRISVFYIENSQSPYEAYMLECEWYHKYAPTCNSIHPSKAHINWNCYVCGL